MTVAPRWTFALAALFVATAGACGGSSGTPDGGSSADAAPDAVPGTDIAERLAAVDGLTVDEVTDELDPGVRLPGYRYFHLHLDQPADHATPGGQRFSHHATLAHRDPTAPMVLHTHGYSNYAGFRLTEPASAVQGNQVTVEHRFFGTSRPAPADWTDLTIRQASDDIHRYVVALAPIYQAAWVSTGASKNGETALMHRRYYPDDVDGTVAYVAPIMPSLLDERFSDILNQFGDQACRDKLKAFQREALVRHQALEDRELAASGAEAYTITGIALAAETAIVEIEFAFWQYTGAEGCDAIPAADADDETLGAALDSISPISSYADGNVRAFEPYIYQVLAELGYAALDHTNLDDLMQFDYENLAAFLPEAPTPTYSNAAVLDLIDWVATDGEGIMLIYGQWDPWTAGELPLGDARDSRTFTVDGVGHWARLSYLPADERAAALGMLSTWAGVAATLPDSFRARRDFGRGDALDERHGGIRP